MWSLIGAAGGALSVLTSLLQSSTSSSAATASSNSNVSLGQLLSGNDGTPPPTAIGSGSTSAPLSSGTLAALIAVQGQTGPHGAGGLFGQLDGDGNGEINEGEFESAVASAGVDKPSAGALFCKLDADGDGSISRYELAKAHHRYHPHLAALSGSMTSTVA